MGRPRNFEDVLSKFPGARQNGDNWTAPCPLPGHKTPADHLTLKDVGDKALVTCQGGRHIYGDFCQAWGYDSLAYSDDGIGGGTAYGQPCQRANDGPKQIRNDGGAPMPTPANPANGLTLARMAEAKRLPMDFLQSLGVRDFKLGSLPVVRIPYWNEAGEEVAVRFRLAMSGDSRFKWRKGDHALPYGLNRLPAIRKAGWVLIVEGESDLWTCWHHGIPALGAPGKGVWPPAWAGYLKGLAVYVWQEPHAQDFTLRVMASAPDLRYIVAPDSIKDISEAHVQGLDVPSWLEGLKANAEAGKALRERAANAQLAAAYQAARRVVEADDPLELAADAIRQSGYGGDLKPGKIVYLAATSRLLEMRRGAMLVHLLFLGPSGIGKNYMWQCVQNLLPPEACHTIDAGSPRALIYDNAELQHRVLVFGEADSLPAGKDNPAASAIRNLLQDCRLHYSVVVRDPLSGDFTVRDIDKPGPTVLITTSTKPLGTQLMTRLFTLEVPDTKAEISARLETQGQLELEGTTTPDAGQVAFQQYLQLKAPIRVIVPFAKELSAAMARMAAAPRILRDFARLISLIKATALIRHYHRKVDSQGRIVAALQDYETVRELVNNMYVDSSTGASNAIRELVNAVTRLHANQTEGKPITNTALAKELGTKDAKGILRRAQRAIRQGWLANKEQRKSYPADYAPGEPMPEVEGLPLPEDIDGRVGTPRKESANPVLNTETGGVDRLAPLTVGDTPPYTPDNGYAAALGMPVEDAVKLWKSQGAPMVHVAPGVNVLDMATFFELRQPAAHVEAVAEWLEGAKP